MAQKEKKQSLVSKLVSLSGKYKGYMILSLVISFISAVLMLMPYVCIWFVAKHSILRFTTGDISQVTELTKYAWLAFIFAILGFILYFISLLCSHTVAFQVAKNLKMKILRHLAKLPLAFFTGNTSGRVRKIIDENAAQTEMFIAHQLPDMIGAFTTPIMMMILLFVFDWKLGLICLIPLVIGFIIQFRMMSNESVKYMKLYQDALEEMNNEAVEYVRGIPVVKVFQQTVYSFKSFHESILKYKKNVIDFSLACKRPMNAFTVAINGSFIVLIPAGLFMLKNNFNSVPFILDLIFYIIFTPACAGMINKIMYMSTYKMMAEESLERIEALLKEDPLPSPENAEEFKNNTVEFKNVSFTYDGSEKETLKNISFKINRGEKIALVGPSGGGKSTIGSLVPRFRDVNEGQVLIGGVDVRNLDERTLMEKVVFVFQNTELFKMSILDNIKIGKPNATREEVMRAIKMAQCEDIIEKLPNHLDTVIGTKGVYLSGGEKQRIALARAILKDAPIIVLDEATAFADPENEYKIQLAFEKLVKNKTVLMIAHRLSTVVNAHEILVVNNGQIIERGNHENLVARKGYYSEMWDKYRESVVWNKERGENYVS